SVCFLVSPGVWIGHQYSRQAEERKLAERAGPRAAQHEVGGGQRQRHVVAVQIAVCMVAGGKLLADAPGKRLRLALHLVGVERAADVQYLAVGQQVWQVGKQRPVDAARAPAPAEHQQGGEVGGEV